MCIVACSIISPCLYLTDFSQLCVAAVGHKFLGGFLATCYYSHTLYPYLYILHCLKNQKENMKCPDYNRIQSLYLIQVIYVINL